jgi:hypothetical protein
MSILKWENIFLYFEYDTDIKTRGVRRAYDPRH